MLETGLGRFPARQGGFDGAGARNPVLGGSGDAILGGVRHAVVGGGPAPAQGLGRVGLDPPSFGRLLPLPVAAVSCRFLLPVSSENRRDTFQYGGVYCACVTRYSQGRIQGLARDTPQGRGISNLKKIVRVKN